MKAAKRKTEFYRLTIDLDKKLYDEIKKLAVKHERTASKEAKVILQTYLGFYTEN